MDPFVPSGPRIEHDPLARTGEHSFVGFHGLPKRINVIVAHWERLQIAGLESLGKAVENHRAFARVERKRVDADEFVPAAIEREDIEWDRPIDGGNENLASLVGHASVGHLEIGTADRVVDDAGSMAASPGAHMIGYVDRGGIEHLDRTGRMARNGWASRSTANTCAAPAIVATWIAACPTLPLPPNTSATSPFFTPPAWRSP